MAQRNPKLERVDIPEECYRVKNFFYVRPTPELVREILEYIRDGGEPHLWRGHTHTPPPASSAFLYLDEFDLPIARIKAKRFAPCPCCTPEFPKYGVRGKIAWFPIEGVIRLMGPNCFAALNRQGHEDALEQMELEQRIARNVSYLLLNLPRLPEAIETLNSALGIAKEIEIFHRRLHADARHILGQFGHVGRTGKLTVWVQRPELREAPGQGLRFEDIAEPKLYANLPGYRMLAPKTPDLVRPLQGALGTLHDVRRQLQPDRSSDGALDWSAAVARLTDERRHNLADRITKDLKAARQAMETAEALQQFTLPLTVTTLRKWGLHVGNQTPYNFALRHGAFCLGRSEASYIAVPIGSAMGRPIRHLDFWTTRERL